MSNQNKSRVLIAAVFATVGGLILAPALLPRDVTQIVLAAVAGACFSALYILRFITWIRERKETRQDPPAGGPTGIQALGDNTNDEPAHFAYGRDKDGADR